MAGAKPGVHVVQLKPIQVPETLVKGNKFIKWDENSQTGTPVTLKVDPKGYILYWKDQNKTSKDDSSDMDFLDISYIRDTRTGRHAKVPKGSSRRPSAPEGKLRDQCMIGPPDIPTEDKTITICYGKDMTSIDFINFVCASRDVAREWTEELLKFATNLLALNSSVLSYLEKAHTKLTHVLDVNGRIPVKNIIKMVAKDSRDDKRKVEKALESVGFMAGKDGFINLPFHKMMKTPRQNETIEPNKFTFEDFFSFYRHLLGRNEVDKVFDEVGAKKKPYLSVEQFVNFLNKEQRDPRLNEILYPYYTVRQAQDIINEYEFRQNMATKGHLSQEGFLRFLLSENNNIVPPDSLDLSHDMNQPLAHYFCNSSHNTYLQGHQLTGRSSVEMYRQVLLSGCRCIELDCWDGRNADEEPMITHGYTMCTEISFKEVIEAIADSAFKTSDYPVILSFENHCSQRQQAKMAAHCRNIFGDMLLTDMLDGSPLDVGIPLPSPNSLMHKIIIKNKKKHFHQREKPKQLSKTQSQMRDAISVDEGGGGTGGGGSNSEGGKRTESVSEDNTSQGIPAPDSNLDEVVSDSSDSDDDNDADDDDNEEARRRRQFKAEKGTAGREAEAGLEMSMLVNYVQPVHFHSFEVSEKRNKSFEISSFVETQATSLLKEYPVEFVNYNKRQLSRIYPRGTRVDSSNFLPQIFWNAGCQLVALNFQTLDLAMQLNLGIFEYNNRCGYVLKPESMRRDDRRFDPFAESIMDGVVAATLTIKVLSGQFLTDKKIGTYVEVDMYGLPTDTVRKRHRTRTVPNNGINPVYDEEPFVFKKVVLPTLAVLRLAVMDENNKLLGHRVLPVDGLRPGYRHIPLRNECNLPLILPTVFVHISVKDYVPDDMSALVDGLINPRQYWSKQEKEKRKTLLSKFFDFGEEFKFTDQELSGKSAKQHTIDKSSSSKSILSNGKTSGPTSPQRREPKRMSPVSVNPEEKPQITKKPNHPLVKPEPSNGQPMQSVSTIQSLLNDPALLVPTPLKDLKYQKAFFKVISKRDKELESLSKKHEKARETMREIHELQEERLMISQVKARTAMEKLHAKLLKKAIKAANVEQVEQANRQEYQKLTRENDKKHKELRKTQAEVFVAMCKDHFQAEMDVMLKHHDAVYDTLKLIMEINHREHEKKLTAIYEMEVEEHKRKMEEHSKKEMKALSKIYKDKNELARIKREAQNKHIDEVVQERAKHKDLLDKKREELKQELSLIQLEFEKEREVVPKEYRASFEEKCRKLTDQFRDVGLCDSREELNGEQNTPL
ncbi:1-phosphatidylinositol 4,5-bisphosphate phosphodiesterase beta-1-like isoform X4 [Ostrea edulis]|uniref:1-phosphatidylinositol 4,5-bisphosphate phosphodiesterase beta-1-like isoform X4 n=1 Tax=Ostrea edulis TaxID=37623 RepID=UPI0024AFE1BB|nr:1-phosphatidylinositol 4,5-bisphosphate phosphodiesterase beta-1-like isoform X4 [Ostrea edulis]